jgi:hypothetical protein
MAGHGGPHSRRRGEARAEQIVAFDAVLEAVHQPPDRRLSAGPFVQTRGGLDGLGHQGKCRSAPVVGIQPSA